MCIGTVTEGEYDNQIYKKASGNSVVNLDQEVPKQKQDH